MSDYTQVTDFSAKDALADGDAEKIILGSDIDAEFSGISTAIASKYDSSDIASTAQAEALSSDVVLITPSGLNDVLVDNGAMLGDIQALADPGADRILFWDNSGTAVGVLTVGNGLDITATTLSLPSSVAGAGLAYSSGVLSVNADEGCKIESDTVRLSDVAAGAAQPVVVTNGTFTFDLSSITALTIPNINSAQDSVLVSDNGTLKAVALDGPQVRMVEFTADDELDATMPGEFLLLTGATDKTMDIPANSVVAFGIGTQMILGTRDTADLTVSPDTGVTLTSYLRSASDTSGDHIVPAGGQVLVTKVATDEWMIVGNIQ